MEPSEGGSRRHADRVNMKHYLRSAHLPEIKIYETNLEGKVGTVVQANITRGLKALVTIPVNDFYDLVFEFIRSLPDETDLSVLELTTPIDNYTTCSISQVLQITAVDQADVRRWLQDIPFWTIHAIHRRLGYANWRFNQPSQPARWMVPYFEWGTRCVIAGALTRTTYLIVAHFPPWILKEKNIKEFLLSIGPLSEHGTTQYRNLWDQLYDISSMAHTRYFILTTYETWIFGEFMEDGFTANVAIMDSAADRSENAPTILESILYWTQRAKDSRDTDYFTGTGSSFAKDMPLQRSAVMNSHLPAVKMATHAGSCSTFLPSLSLRKAAKMSLLTQAAVSVISSM
ncbi:hypothetical protein BOTBODRAFT_290477 [Botryobasidium botryosum FD-172 SS1]|uniref:Uncharacterized protein n=1 Tax=Botryobasidium botryosum (strain FD-172 SS1) TaxID=930990 RepID=A0A067MKZ8_BOTB1|nr:hypothetical protein BOTBODRAFT_290477 [Botryobasidium botryosum FD-172 SS1]